MVCNVMTNSSLLNKEYRTWLIDSRRWAGYVPKKGDVIVATYPKSGTTWLQRIVSLLIFQSTRPIELDGVFPWWECRTGPSVESLAIEIARQSHRRSIKTHLPLDGLPIFDEVKYIHVARDGRDVCLSYHNHCLAHTDRSLDAMNRVGAQDLTLQRPYPEIPKDPAEFFHNWLTRGAIDGQEDGSPFLSYFAFEKTYASASRRDNLLFIHYADLKQNLIEEMARIADFMEVLVDRATLVKLADSASFEKMREEGMALIPRTAKLFRGEAERLFYKGRIGEWRGLFKQEDLELFEKKLGALPKEYAAWLIAGRSGLPLK